MECWCIDAFFFITVLILDGFGDTNVVIGLVAIEGSKR